MKSEAIKRNIDSLAMLRALGLFFFNWRQEAMEDLCEKSREWKYIWEKLSAQAKVRREKEGGMWTVEHTDIYDAFFTQISYATKAIVLEKAMELHGDEAKHDVEFNLELAELQDKIKKEKFQ